MYCIIWQKKEIKNILNCAWPAMRIKSDRRVSFFVRSRRIQHYIDITFLVLDPVRSEKGYPRSLIFFSYNLGKMMKYENREVPEWTQTPSKSAHSAMPKNRSFPKRSLHGIYKYRALSHCDFWDGSPFRLIKKFNFIFQ